MSTSAALHVIPALKARRLENGRVILTQKFIDGIRAYQQRWAGDVVVHMMPASVESGNLGETTHAITELPFRFEWIEQDVNAVVEAICDAGIVLASLVDPHLALAEPLAGLHVPLVFVAEYTSQTRRQIIDTNTTNPLLRWRRSFWTMQFERRIRRALPIARGVQCNGTPTYDAYRDISPNAMLYFDTRTSSVDIIDDDALESRLSSLDVGDPLRLAYSGRLVPMKGVDHLPLVAEALRRRDVPFTMTIFGDGASRPSIERMIEARDLGDVVHLTGEVDFQSELLPRIRQDVDLFVCCHRQGDPSCTYMETMACGTPIVGYANEAFDGLVRTLDVGWATPLDDPDSLAERIALAHHDRASIARAARDARSVARQHTFERTVDARIAHLTEIAHKPARRVAS